MERSVARSSARVVLLAAIAAAVYLNTIDALFTFDDHTALVSGEMLVGAVVHFSMRSTQIVLFPYRFSILM